MSISTYSKQGPMIYLVHTDQTARSRISVPKNVLRYPVLSIEHILILCGYYARYVSAKFFLTFS